MMARRWRIATALGLVAALIVGGLVVRRQARLGALQLTTDGPATAVRIHEHSGRVILPALTAPTSEPVPLAEGTYDLVATRPGAPTLSARFDVTRGQIVTHHLDLSVEQMGPSLPIDQGRNDRFGFVDFGTRRDLLVARGNGSGVARHDLAAGRVVWDARADDRSSDALIAVDPLPEAKRLDADDETDVIWGNATNLVAMSGRTGLLLWSIRPDGAARLAGPACWIGDIDNDGAEDLAWQGSGDPASGFVEARSGRDGHRLWRADLPAPPDESIPLTIFHGDGRPIVLAVAKAWVVALGATNGQLVFEPIALPFAPNRAPHGTDRDADGSGDHLILSNSDTLRVIAARDGIPVGPDSAVAAGASDAPHWLDADRLLTSDGGPSGFGRITVTAPANGAVTWRFPAAGVTASGTGSYPIIDVNQDRCRDVIVVRRVFLLALPPADPAPVRIDPPRPGNDNVDIVEALDGTSGAVLWSRTSRVTTGVPSALITGPEGLDLDGDGVPEVFFASIGLRVPDPIDPHRWRHSPFVEAFSGASGRPLWRWQGGLFEAPWVAISLRWRASGTGRHPALVVRYGPRDDNDPTLDRIPTQTWVLRPEDGAVIQDLPGTPDPSLIDVDKDGVDDLVVVPKSGQMTLGAVTAFRGHPPVAWRRLGHWHRTADLDGDRNDDAYGLIMNPNASQSGPDSYDHALRALSLRDGRILWETQLSGFYPYLNRGGDGDGDGIAEFLEPRRLTPRIISGGTGRSLGVTEGDGDDRLLGSMGAGSRVSLTPLLGGQLLGSWEELAPPMADGDGDGVAEVLAWFRRIRWPTAAGEDESTEAVVAALDARSGAVRWEATLVTRAGQVPIFTRGWLAELDGMPGTDLITLCVDAGKPARYLIAAWRGRDGHELWSRPVAKVVQWPSQSESRLPDVAAFDLDGDTLDEVILADRVEGPDAANLTDPDGPNRGTTPLAAGRLLVTALGGRDGAERWAWSGPDWPALADAGAHDWSVRVRASRRAEGGPILWVDQAQLDPARPQQVSVRQFRLDARGHQLDEHAGELLYTRRGAALANMAINAWAATDFDGDGTDEVVRYDGSTRRLEAFGSTGAMARAGPALPPEAVFGLALQYRGDRPAAVVTPWSHGEPEPITSAYDLADGTPLGPPGRVRQPLSGGRPGATRHLITTPDMIWVEEFGDVPTSRGPTGQDPRWARPLPWADWPMIRYVVGSVPFSLVLLALPAWALIRTARTRSLRWAFVAVAAIALAVAAYRQRWLPIDVNEDLRSPRWRAAQVVGMAFVLVHRATGGMLDPRWVQVAVGLPLVALPPALWAWRRRWGRVLVAFAIASGLAALVWWAVDRRIADPSEHSTSQDWYLIGFWGAYALGIAAIVASIPLPRRRTGGVAS